MRNKIVIFDGNHLAYRAYYKFANLKTLDGVKTSIIYGMPYIAESLIRRLSPNEVAVVFDGGRSNFRMRLLPTYKAREKKLGFDVEDFRRQKDVGRDIFMSLGLSVAVKEHTEADDIIAMITRRFSVGEWDVIIVSGDKDFNQLITFPVKGINGEVTVYNTSKGRQFEYNTLEKEVGYRPEQCVDYLSLVGDKSDHIDGYPGIGPVKALLLLKKYGSIGGFLKSGDKFGKVNKVKLLEIWKRNKKLISLKYYYRKFLKREAIPWLYQEGINLDKFKKLCGTYETNSFLKPQFINTFKNISSG